MSGIGIGIGLKLGGTRGRPGTPAPTYAERVLATSPLAYWSLNQSSGLEATDLSGNGYHAKVSGGTWDAGQGPDGGGALRFDGVNDFVDLFTRSSGSLNGLKAALPFAELSLLVSARVLDVTVWQDSNYAYLLDVNGNLDRLKAFKANGPDAVRFLVDSGSATDVSYADEPGGWITLGLTYQANGVRRFFARGAKQGEETVAGAVSTSWAWAYLGALSGPQSSWNGWLRDAVVWGSALDEPTMLSLLTR